MRRKTLLINMKVLSRPSVALGDLVIGTLPLDSRFAGSNTSEEDGLLRAEGK
jgi:hypothetical protein